jgi:hypothetical protein
LVPIDTVETVTVAGGASVLEALFTVTRGTGALIGAFTATRERVVDNAVSPHAATSNKTHPRSTIGQLRNSPRLRRDTAEGKDEPLLTETA